MGKIHNVWIAEHSARESFRQPRVIINWKYIKGNDRWIDYDLTTVNVRLTI